MTRLEMEAVINGGGVVLWNGELIYTIEDLPTQEEIDAATLPPAQGPPGDSAYTIAVQNGFVGTEEEWLDSLQGDTGPQGPEGPEGDPGTGDVVGPASSTNDNIAVFDGVTGKLIKDGGATLASKQDALGFTPVPNTRTVGGHALSSDVTLVKGDVGLGNVDNTSDTNKPVSTAQQTALDGKVNDTGDETIAGVKTFSSDPIIPDEAYDATAWNGSMEPPTKNAVRDKLETMGSGPGSMVHLGTCNVGTGETAYAGPVWNTTGASSGAADENMATIPCPVAGTFSNMFIKNAGTSGTSGGGTGSTTYTLRKNKASTALTVTRNNNTTASSAASSDTTNSVTFAVGDLISVLIVNSGNGSTGNVSIWARLA